VDRNVILYGNADTNSAWPQLLSDCPIQVGRGHVRIRGRSDMVGNVSLLMVYPRADSDVATIGVVAGTSPMGMALTNRIRYFVSGIPFPDLVIVDAKTWAEGPPPIGGWGYFGRDWSVENGDFGWRDGL